MAVKSHKRGWEIVWIDDAWFYSDDLSSCEEERPCVRCQHMPTREGYDACLGRLEDVEYACCGHGVHPSYIRKTNEQNV